MSWQLVEGLEPMDANGDLNNHRHLQCHKNIQFHQAGRENIKESCTLINFTGFLPLADATGH